MFGSGDSQIRAKSFQNKFIKINKHLIIADQYGESAWNTVGMSHKDCGLFISYGGSTTQHIKILKYLKSKTITTILLTGSPESEMAKLADVIIEVPHDEYDFFKIGTFSSQISFEYILDTLFSSIYALDYSKNLNSLKKKELILDQWDL